MSIPYLPKLLCLNYQNKVQIFAEVLCKIFPWSVKAAYEPDNLDQLITFNSKEIDTYRQTPYTIESKNNMKVITPITR